MAVISIPWTTGSGSITLTYDGEGGGSVSVTSDANELTEAREQTVTLTTTAGTPVSSATVVIRQAASAGEILVLTTGEAISLVDGDTISIAL